MKFKIGTLLLVAMFFVSSASAECRSCCNITDMRDKVTTALTSAKNSTVDFFKRNHRDNPYYLYSGTVVVATAVGALVWYVWKNQNTLKRSLRRTLGRSYTRAATVTKRVAKTVEDTVEGIVEADKN